MNYSYKLHLQVFFLNQPHKICECSIVFVFVFNFKDVLLLSVFGCLQGEDKLRPHPQVYENGDFSQLWGNFWTKSLINYENNS